MSTKRACNQLVLLSFEVCRHMAYQCFVGSVSRLARNCFQGILGIDKYICERVVSDKLEALYLKNFLLQRQPWWRLATFEYLFRVGTGNAPSTFTCTSTKNGKVIDSQETLPCKFHLNRSICLGFLLIL